MLRCRSWVDFSNSTVDEAAGRPVWPTVPRRGLRQRSRALGSVAVGQLAQFADVQPVDDALGPGNLVAGGVLVQEGHARHAGGQGRLDAVRVVLHGDTVTGELLQVLQGEGV